MILSYLEDDLVLGALLLLVLEDIDVPERAVGGRDVVALGVLANLLNSLVGLIVELDLLEVGPDTRGGDRLGDYTLSANLGPSEDDLRGCNVNSLGLRQLVGDGLDLGGVDEQRQTEAIVSKGRVGRDVDVILVAEGNHLVLVKLGVALDLIDGGGDARVGDDLLQLGDGEVGDTDGAGLGLGKLVHGLPGVGQGDALIEVDFAVVAGLPGEEGIAGGEGDGPVDEIELACQFGYRLSYGTKTYIKVLQLQLGESLVESTLNLLRTVTVVPQLGGDEDVLALQAGNLLVSLLDALRNLLLVLVDLGQVEVTIASLECLKNTSTDLARGCLPGAVSQRRDLVTGGESGVLS